jgi:predicted dehydrogenase
LTDKANKALPDTETYALTAQDVKTFEAPELNYQPPMPKTYRPRIALVGAGGISAAHLDAYRSASFDVAAICSRTLSRAEARRDEFFPNAYATDRFEDILSDGNIEVLDITPHPEDRFPLIEQALQAQKHVLSQKPFVVDLDSGEHLVALAQDNNVKLAINQNGRWAPHLAYMRKAVQGGLIGDLLGCHISIHWDHSWISGTPFEDIEDLVLFDFAIHWFDFLASVGEGRIRSVFATKAKAQRQQVKPPMLAQALVKMDGGQASLIFNAATQFGPQDTTYISGTKGSLSSAGPDLGQQRVCLTTIEGRACPKLDGTWFNDGFRGAMGELLCSIEEKRDPSHSAQNNLSSLALTFAAIQSSREETEIQVGEVRHL